MNSHHSRHCVCGKVLRGHQFELQRSVTMQLKPSSWKQCTVWLHGIIPMVCSEAGAHTEMRAHQFLNSLGNCFLFSLSHCCKHSVDSLHPNLVQLDMQLFTGTVCLIGKVLSCPGLIACGLWLIDNWGEGLIKSMVCLTSCLRCLGLQMGLLGFICQWCCGLFMLCDSFPPTSVCGMLSTSLHLWIYRVHWLNMQECLLQLHCCGCA